MILARVVPAKSLNPVADVLPKRCRLVFLADSFVGLRLL
jgi:hypothetical protein